MQILTCGIVRQLVESRKHVEVCIVGHVCLLEDLIDINIFEVTEGHPVHDPVQVWRTVECIDSKGFTWFL